MIVDFSKLDLKKRQVLVLENLDGTVIQPLLHVLDGTAKLHLNEVSELTFSVPSVEAGSPVAGYNAIVGMRVIDWVGVGKFILVEPQVVDDGIVYLKKCKAYSLEYELSYKTFALEEKSYTLFEIFDKIFENAPSWSLGECDLSVMSKYRHFSGESYNVYDFLKNTAQELYGCLFDFDTYTRTIHVVDATKVVAQRPVFLSTKNLAKEIVVTEQTESLFTAFNVTGAEDVDIRAVNPTGSNIIYNLDYFMNRDYFSQEIIDKWSAWKNTCADNRERYYLLTLDLILQQQRLVTEQAAQILLEAELDALKLDDTTLVQLYASTNDAAAVMSYDYWQKLIADKEEELALKVALCSAIQEEIDSIVAAQQLINKDCDLASSFDEQELLLLDKYIRIADLNEPSFVYKEALSYTDEDLRESKVGIDFEITDAEMTCIPLADTKILIRGEGGSFAATVYSLVGSNITATGTISGELRDMVLEDYGDGTVIVTAEIQKGQYNEKSFSEACLTILVNPSADVATNVDLSSFTADETIGDNYKVGSFLCVSTNPTGALVSTFFITGTQTAYSKHLVQWDLLEFAEQEIQKAAWPRYQFTIDSANFLTAQGFEAFKNQFKLGARNYIETYAGVITPIAIGATIDFDHWDKLILEFGDEYSAFNSEFQLVDILGQSVSSVKKYESSKGAYNRFVSTGAQNQLCDFTTGALDLAKNAIMSSTNQAVQFDSTGLKLRKYVGQEGKQFDDRQMWAVNNSIVFTKDNWATAEMAVGELRLPWRDDNGDVIWTYGVCAPALIGEIIASNYLMIRSATEHGGVAEFVVDSAGARLRNAKFDLMGDGGHISLNPDYGFVGGSSGVIDLFGTSDDGTYGVKTELGNIITAISELGSDELPRAKFWIDMHGDAYFGGKIQAAEITSAVINGPVTSGSDDAVIEGVSIDVGNGKFTVDKDGNVVMDGGIKLGGNITWSTPPIMSMYSTTDFDPIEDPEDWHEEMREDDIYRTDSYDGGKTWCAPYQFRGKDGESAELPDYIEDTYISSVEIKSPEITGNKIRALKAFEVGSGSGYMGYAKGSTGSETTYGVALSDGGFDSGCIDADTTGINYLIVTDAGVRMQSSTGANIYVAEGDDSVNGAAYIEVGSTTYKFQADGIYMNGTKVI